MANEVIIQNSGDTNDQWRSTESGGFEGVGPLGVGYISYLTSTNRKMKCAIRFPSVDIPDGGCNYAGLYFYTEYNGKSDGYPRSGNWNFRIRGVDEDNTSDFSSGNPFGRAQTTAYNDSSNGDEPDTGTYKEINVTDAVNEIMSRGGWNPGNSIALLLDPTEESSNKYATDDYQHLSFLVIRRDAEPNFKPTPKSVSAPSFPAANSYGMKISYPGYEVLTCTEDQTLFTTRKRCLKVVAQGKINTTGGVVYNIAHGQSIKPFAKAYFKSTSSSKRYKIPRFTPGEQQDPDSDTTNGQIEVDGTNVKILTTDSCEVYYYIYIDELAT